MRKHLSLFACAIVACSGQTCGININPIQRVPLNDADAEIRIFREIDDATARVEATITSGFALVRLDDDQNVAVNDRDLLGDRGDYARTIDAADAYDISVSDPRRGTDHTEIEEPASFEISMPGEGGDASLSGFTIEWTNADAALDVDVKITQVLLGESLSLELDRVPDVGAIDVTSRQIAEAGFGQGRDLKITVTRIRTNSNIRGFRDGKAFCELSTSINVTPTP